MYVKMYYEITCWVISIICKILFRAPILIFNSSLKSFSVMLQRVSPMFSLMYIEKKNISIEKY